MEICKDYTVEEIRAALTNRELYIKKENLEIVVGTIRYNIHNLFLFFSSIHEQNEGYVSSTVFLTEVRKSQRDILKHLLLFSNINMLLPSNKTQSSFIDVFKEWEKCFSDVEDLVYSSQSPREKFNLPTPTCFYLLYIYYQRLLDFIISPDDYFNETFPAFKIENERQAK